MAENQRSKLTKRVVDAAEPAAQRYVIHDTGLPGFRLVVTPSGKKTYAVRYRVGGGRKATIREPAIGAHGVITVDQARRIAGEWLAEAAKGNDPSATREASRDAPRMKDLFDRYLAEHSRAHKKPSSIAFDERMIRDVLRPELGNKKVTEISRADVSKLHGALSKKPAAANRVLALLSNIFNVAEAWGLRPDGTNPCRHVKKYREEPRKRFLSIEEMGRLGDALRSAERGELGPVLPQAVAAIRLLMFTGCRKSEILGLRWQWVDPVGARINLPDSKTGFKSVPLPPAALAILDALPRQPENPHVIVGAKPGAHLVNLKDPWELIRSAAKLSDVRLHDLRHSYAAIGAAGGHPLHIVGALLGHSQAATTRRYAHLADDPLQAASRIISDRIAAALDAQPASIVPLRSITRGQ